MQIRLFVQTVIGTVLVAGLAASAAATCYYKAERVSGMNKICLYSCTSGEAAYTVRSTDLCPLTINR